MTSNKPSSMRYGDDELIWILHRIAYDNNKKPSQRMVGSDKDAPTHHTYVNRFGSIIKALESAGLDGAEDGTHYHKIIGNWLHDGFANVAEWAEIGPIRVDYAIALDDGKVFFVDFVHLDGVDSGVNSQNQKRRQEIADGVLKHSRNMYYIQIQSPTDIYAKIKGIG